MATPSIDARLVNRLGLRQDVKRIPIWTWMCSGAIGTARLFDYLKAYPNDVALLLSVGSCSLTLQRRTSPSPTSSPVVCLVMVLPVFGLVQTGVHQNKWT